MRQPPKVIQTRRKTCIFSLRHKIRVQFHIPSRAEGPREMFSLGAATFLGGILKFSATVWLFVTGLLRTDELGKEKRPGRDACAGVVLQRARAVRGAVGRGRKKKSHTKIFGQFARKKDAILAGAIIYSAKALPYHQNFEEWGTFR